MSTFDSMSSVNRSPWRFYEAPQQDTSFAMWLDVDCACLVVGGSADDCLGLESAMVNPSKSVMSVSMGSFCCTSRFCWLAGRRPANKWPHGAAVV